MTADDNVLLSKDPVARRVLLDLLEGCQDLREATARLTETVLNALMSMQADECILMLLYIVKGFGVLGWLVRGGDGLDPEGGATFEFGQVAGAAFDLADAAGGDAEGVADLLLGDAVRDA